MFDIGWVELLFIATMTLVIVGPKDMPGLLSMLGKIAGRARKVYNDLFQSIKRLEQEVDTATRSAGDSAAWHDHLPESVRDPSANLPADFVPGSISAEQHQARRERVERTGQRAESQQQTEPQQQVEPQQQAGQHQNTQ